MRFIGYVFILTITVSVLNGQSIRTDSLTAGERLFYAGVNAMNEKNYQKADSLFSEALCLLQNEDVYFNRGLTRLLLSDTLGFCQDLDIAANKYHDPYSTKVFNAYCCIQIDTLFLNEKYELASDSNGQFFEIIKQLKYESEILGTIHNAEEQNLVLINQFNCESDIPVVQSRVTDVIAKYILRDSIRLFYETPQPIRAKNEVAYGKFLSKLERELHEKCDFIKSKNEVTEIELFYEYTISETGEFTQPKFLGTFPELVFFEDIDMLESVLLEFLKKHPKFIPAKIEGIKVNYIEQNSIIF